MVKRYCILVVLDISKNYPRVVLATTYGPSWLRQTIQLKKESIVFKSDYVSRFLIELPIRLYLLSMYGPGVLRRGSNNSEITAFTGNTPFYHHYY